MRAMTLRELDELLAQDDEFVRVGREMRPELNLADDVFDFRIQAGMSQADLAAQVGTNQANISRLESALANPTLKFLKKLAGALGAVVDVRLRRPDDIPAASKQVSETRTETQEQYVAVDWPIARRIENFVISTRAGERC